MAQHYQISVEEDYCSCVKEVQNNYGKDRLMNMKEKSGKEVWKPYTESLKDHYILFLWYHPIPIDWILPMESHLMDKAMSVVEVQLQLGVVSCVDFVAIGCYNSSDGGLNMA